MEDVNMHIISNISRGEKIYFIKIKEYKFTYVKDFCKLLGCYQKTFLKNMDQFNHYLYIYVGQPDRLDFFFHSEEDAKAAKEWIESQLLMKKFLKNCLQNTSNMI